MGDTCCKPNPPDAVVDQFLARTGISLSALAQSQSTDPTIIMLAGKQEDPKNFVKNYLIYSFYIKKYRTTKGDYQQKFMELISRNKWASKKQNFEQFYKIYKKEGNDLSKSTLLLNYAIKEPYFLDIVNETLSSTEDPKIIGYLTFILARLTEAIKKQYKSQQTNKRQEIYVVLALKKQEVKTLQKIKGQNIILSFRSFIKGFSTEKAARTKIKKMEQNKEQSDKKIVLLIINFQKLNQLQQSLDNGYFKAKQQATSKQNSQQVNENIIFNLFQGFRVDSSDSEKQFNLTYSYISQLYHSRYVDRITSTDDSALHLYNMCHSVSQHYLKTQSALLRILKTERESISLSQQLTAPENQEINYRTSIVQTPLNQIQNLVNIYIDQEEYQKALKVANQYESSFFLIKAKKLQILYKSGTKDQAKKYLDELLKNSQKNNRQNSQANEIIQFITVKMQMENNQKGKAKERIKELHKKMFKKYSNGYQVIGREVIACMQKIAGVNEFEQQSQFWVSAIKEQKRNIELSGINLRGISTTI